MRPYRTHRSAVDTSPAGLGRRRDFAIAPPRIALDVGQPGREAGCHAGGRPPSSPGVGPRLKSAAGRDQDGGPDRSKSQMPCHRFRANEVRPLLGVITYDLGNLLRLLAV